MTRFSTALPKYSQAAQDDAVDITSSTAFITGANRGLGRRFALDLIQRGARVYAGARDPGTIDVEGTIPVAVDITDPESVAVAAAAAGDVTLLVNNAGISTGANLLTGDLADIHREFDTNVFGTLSMVRAFAPVIERNGGGAILNVLSVLSWLSMPMAGAYCAAKAASWSLTNELRLDLADKGIAVTALHVGPMDTDMMAGSDVPKSDPAAVAAMALDGVASGAFEVLADDVSRMVQAGLAKGVAGVYPQLAT